jgi:DNA-binding MarR family transcriptional regulator
MNSTVHRIDHARNPDGPQLIGALLRRPFLASRARIVAALHEAGFTDIQPAHLAVFQHPGPDGRSPGDIARSALATKQAMNNLLTQLERAGYLARVVSAANRRERTVALTDRGREAVATIREAVTAIEAAWKQSLGAAEYLRLRRSLESLNAALSPDDQHINTFNKQG